MEGASEWVPLMGGTSPARLTETRDVETGLHRYLSVETVEASLEGKKVRVLTGREICMNFFSGQAASFFFGVASVVSVLVYIFPALFACPTTDDDFHNYHDPKCFYPVLFGAPLVTICCVISCLSSVVCARSGHQLFTKVKSQRHNQQLSDVIHQLTYADTKSEALAAHDFITLYQEGFFEDGHIKDLSFTQIRDIRQLSASMEEEQKIQQYIRDHWSFRQRAPWERLNMIRSATLKELSENLTADYIRTLIENTPGFFDELLTVLSYMASERSDFQSAILEHIRDHVNRKFSYEFSDDGILQAMKGVADGGNLEKCFRMQMTEDSMITLRCGELNFDLPKSILMSVSGFFRAQLHFDKGINEMTLDDLPEEYFEVFIHYLQGKKMPVNEENVDQFLSISNYFEITSLAEACQTPLLLKYEEYDLESKLELLEDFPILKGRFQDHVDQECVKQFSFKDNDDFIEYYARAKYLGLTRTVKAMENAVLDLADRWIENGACICSLDHFVKKVLSFHSYLPDNKRLTEKLIEIIHLRISNNRELNGFYEKVLHNPTFLLVKALHAFVHAEEHQDQVYSELKSVKAVIDTLEDLKTRFEADVLLISDIKDWETLAMMRGSFDEFISQISKYQSSIQMNEFRTEIEDRLINIIRSRIANTDAPSKLEAKAYDNPLLKKALNV